MNGADPNPGEPDHVTRRGIQIIGGNWVEGDNHNANFLSNGLDISSWAPDFGGPQVIGVDNLGNTTYDLPSNIAAAGGAQAYMNKINNGITNATMAVQAWNLTPQLLGNTVGVAGVFGVTNGVITSGVVQSTFVNDQSTYFAGPGIGQTGNVILNATQTFFTALGFSSADVNRDIVRNSDAFYGKYYSAFANGKVNAYTSSWQKGVLDSYNKTRDAATSAAINFYDDDLLVASYQLKYYPSRAGGIGLDQVGAGHIAEAAWEGLDGLVRQTTGYDNVIYDMQGTNATTFLQLWGYSQQGSLTIKISK